MKSILISCEPGKPISIDDLSPLQGELKSLSEENYQKLKKQILKNGFSAAIHVWRDGEKAHILDGHQRLKTLQRLRKEGYSVPEIPIVEVKANDIKHAKEQLLSHASMFGTYDVLGLRAFAEDAAIEAETLFTDFEFPGLDWDSLEDKKSVFDESSVDDVPEAPQEPITKLGDLWLLGSHRLLCGDSTNPILVDKLMDGQSADMIYTDPPYGMNLDTDWSSVMSSKDWGGRRSGKYEKIIGDDKDFDPSFIFERFKDTKEMFLWGADYYAKHLTKNGSWIVWDKRTDKSGNILDAMIGSEFELCWSKNKHKRSIVRILWSGFFGPKDKGEVKRCHPTQKPVSLSEWFINNFSKDEWLLVDLFGGSGSTLIACEKLGRKCFMMELDPKYCDVIVKRFEDLTGKKAMLCND